MTIELDFARALEPNDGAECVLHALDGGTE